MGVFDFVRSGVKEMRIARPEAYRAQLLYRHPDERFPVYAQLLVDGDESAVFVRDGAVAGSLASGRHALHPSAAPFLASLASATRGGEPGQVVRSQIYFVRTAPLRSVPFSGPIGAMRDPQLGCLVTPLVSGEMTLVVTDPAQFVAQFVARHAGEGSRGAGGAAPDGGEALSWVKGLFMAVVKARLAELCERQEITLIDAIAYTTELTEDLVSQGTALSDAGLRVLQMGAFAIHFSADDDATLNEANERVTGGIARARRDIRGATRVTCPACGAKQAGGKFCSECGNALTEVKKYCTGCGGSLAGEARFCSSCGTAAAAPGG